MVRQTHATARYSVLICRSAGLAAILLITGLLTAGWAADVPASEQTTLALGDGNELPITVYPGTGTALLLLIPSEHGVLAEHHELARALGTRGLESWVADPFGAYFLPTGPSGLDEIPARSVAELIEAAALTAKTVYLLSHDRGAALALSGARDWQLAHPGADRLGGVVLISPYLLQGTPEVGREARYQGIAGASNLPLYLLQPVRSPLYWRLPGLVRELERSGSSVFFQTLPAARDRYFFRPDAQPDEDELAARLPGLVRTALGLLATQQRTREAAAQLATPRGAEPDRTERRLRPYTGDPRPPPLRLPDLAERTHQLSDYADRVLLVNFWASWCPPCVHEMPSMQSLRDDLRDRPFEILAVNLGEAPAPVRAFMQSQRLDLTVLMDPAGQAVRDWRVYAYPTSYLIDKRGRIRFAVFGAIDWLDPFVVETIAGLLTE
ncbi:MAG: TlpA disulfide reductase family protein [Chromatiales bacterium]|jgi:thiol-disulfide isomerase/thioredoxin